jgi:hypothetical protein
MRQGLQPVRKLQLLQEIQLTAHYFSSAPAAATLSLPVARRGGYGPFSRTD